MRTAPKRDGSSVRRDAAGGRLHPRGEVGHLDRSGVEAPGPRRSSGRTRLGLVLLSLGLLAPFLGPEGGASGTSGSVQEETVLVLAGPNDGEPINSRMLSLKAATNYRDFATISVYVNRVFISSRSFQLDAAPDLETGLLSTSIDIDLAEVRARLGDAVLGPDAAPLLVSAYLLDSRTQRVVAFADWRIAVPKPWLEVLGVAALDEDVHEVQGKVPAVAHTLAGDSYFMVLVSTRSDALLLSPENPELFRGARIVKASNVGAVGASREIAYLDTALDPLRRQVYAVLWTYDDVRGWKRSTIYAVPRPPR